MYNFRHGQWVRFSHAMPEIFKNPDGKCVGIYQQGGTDALGAKTDNRVMPCNIDGANIRRISEDGNSIETLQLNPTELKDLEPLADISHIPAKRQLTLAPGWNPLDEAKRSGWTE